MSDSNGGVYAFKLGQDPVNSGTGTSTDAIGPSEQQYNGEDVYSVGFVVKRCATLEAAAVEVEEAMQGVQRMMQNTIDERGLGKITLCKGSVGQNEISGEFEVSITYWVAKEPAE